MCHSNIFGDAEASRGLGLRIPRGPSANRVIRRRTEAAPIEMKAGTKGVRVPRFLFIDAYDSFSNNIIALLHESLTTVEQQPIIEKITIDQAPYWPLDDHSRDLFTKYLSSFDAVIAGPGPGDPANVKDVGLFRCLWSLPEAQQLPVLGICLGFQSMCLDAGASVIRLPQGRHGIVTEVDHCNNSIFAQLGHLQATHYHSLHVNLDHPIQTGVGFQSSAQMWKASLGLPRIIPLAWDCSPPSPQNHRDSQHMENKRYNGAILMAGRIQARPWWGVQYHPESICSGKDEAKLLIANWWKESEAWAKSRADPLDVAAHDGALTQDDSGAKRRNTDSAGSERSTKRLQTTPISRNGFSDGGSEAVHAKGNVRGISGPSEADSDGEDDPPDVDEDEDEENEENEDNDDIDDDPDTVGDVRDVPAWFGGFRYSAKVVYEKMFVQEPARERAAQHVRDLVDRGTGECIVLESGQSGIPRSTGRFSIVGLVDETSIKICYFRAARTVLIFRADDIKPIFVASGVDFALYWRSLKKHFHADGGNDTSPFWGGSFLCHSYEACLDTIGASLDKKFCATSGRPDIFGVVIMRSIVVDHYYHDAWIQSIAPNDKAWVRQAKEVLNGSLGDPQLVYDLEYRECEAEDLLRMEIQSADVHCSSSALAPLKGEIALSRGGIYAGPSRVDYESKVRECQANIAAGDSYELCLTGQTTILMPLTRYPRLRDDLLYKNLTQHNPAPFGARIQLTLGQAGVTVFSSSPERFLSWDRGKKCEFRPIKGTLRKADGMTREDAEAYFKSTKERAENLMITDLIRHDLYGVLQHPDSVKVPPEKLFAVEEYSTVYQLVTCVEGRFRYNSGKTGIDVLNASLPPGSMTGAPKKRSCELLQQTEDFRPRGLFSGVIGYDDVGGGGDFSVLIRAAVRWDGDVLREEGQQGHVLEFERWTIGAGGAVTALSDPTDEYHEMVTKRSAVLQAFVGLPGRLSAQS